MNTSTPAVITSAAYYRLIALWAVIEAFAGGIMHGLKIPFTGLIVGSLAVTCIVLLARFANTPGAIIKATIIVAGFKLMLSPHSPPTAYIAVFFQGLLGELLFRQRKYFTAAAMVLAVLALVESALQRLLVLVILYGNNFWDAVDQYIQKLLGRHEGAYSLWLAEGYVGLHFIAGFFVGWYASKLSRQVVALQSTSDDLIIALPNHLASLAGKRKKQKKLKWLLLGAWLVLMMMYVHSIFFPGTALLPTHDVLLIFIRSLLILLTWYLFVSPIVMYFIRKSLEKSKAHHQDTRNKVLAMLPQTYFLFKASWLRSQEKKGLKRLLWFNKILLVNILFDREAAGPRKINQ